VLDPTDKLRPADPSDVASALSFALQYDGRRRVRHADTMMARIVADRLIKHLEASGFVVMKKPDGVAPSTSGMPVPGENGLDRL
jgi:hypothetical protein